jgi:hypothetical protein
MPISTERPMPRIVAGNDLMAALRQSIENAVTQTPAKPAVAPKGKLAAKGNPAQREILLPIAGGALAKEAPEKQEQKPGAEEGGIVSLVYGFVIASALPPCRDSHRDFSRRL